MTIKLIERIKEGLLKVMKEKGPLSMIELEELTGMSPYALSTITKVLVEEEKLTVTNERTKKFYENESIDK